MPHPPTFIVGTGRCGSTLLSNMLAQHPAIVSISEFFGMATDLGGRSAALFPPGPVPGPAMWRIFGVPGRRLDLLTRHRIPIGEEVLYPCESPNARYHSHTGVPMVLLSTIPHLSTDPDACFDALREFVVQLPAAAVGTQYRRVFEWFRGRFGGELWVERSGASLYLLEALDRAFPGARYIHVTRDGRDAACSMREHRAFRMFLIGELLTSALGVDPFYSDDRSKSDRLPASLRGLLPECFDAAAFERFEVPLRLTGSVWSEQITKAYRVLDAVPSHRRLTIRYEDLIADPANELRRLASYLGRGLLDDVWLSRAAALARSPRRSWRTLPAGEREILRAVCEPGLTLLAEHGIGYDA